MTDKKASSKAVGYAWTPALAASISDDLENIACVEIIAENFFNQEREFLERLRDHNTPVFIHCVGLSIGSASGIDPRHLDRVLNVASQVNAINFSDHLGYCHIDGMETLQPAMLPYNRASLDVVCENIAYVQSRSDLPFLIENEANRFLYLVNDMSETAFLNQIVRETRCEIILDLYNLYANSINFAFDAQQWLRSLDLDSVGYLHLAGGQFDQDGFLLDSHDAPIPDTVWQLLTWTLNRCNPSAIIVERTDREANFATVRQEAALALDRWQSISSAKPGHSNSQQNIGMTL